MVVIGHQRPALLLDGRQCTKHQSAGQMRDDDGCDMQDARDQRLGVERLALHVRYARHRQSARQTNVRADMACTGYNVFDVVAVDSAQGGWCVRKRFVARSQSL